MSRGLILLAALLSLAGCSGDAELSKNDEEVLRNNIGRDLTPDEISRIGGGGADGPKGVAPPPKKG